MPLQRNEFMPQDLVAVYNSPSGLLDTRTGYPYQMGGLLVGGYFDLTEAEAQTYGRAQLHEGRYRFVQIDSGATASNILRGTIGLMKSLALGVNVITSYDKGLNANIRPVVFLAPITATQVSAGAYVFVQEQGDASVLAAGTITASAGTAIESTTGGVVDNGSTNPIGRALATASINTLFRAMIDLPLIQG